MASIPSIPPVLNAYINTGSITSSRFYNANPAWVYEYTVFLTVATLANSETPNLQFDARNVAVGQWFMQSSGLAYLITNIVTPTTDNKTITVTLRDVDLYNLLSDVTSSNNNQPTDGSGTGGIIFSLSEDGMPIVSYTSLLGYSGATSWLNDALGRFSYRNLVKSYYNFDLNNNLANGAFNYSSYSIGQVVYIGDNGSGLNVFLPVDPTVSDQVAKSFGIVTSLNQPELGNIYVRPFGKGVTKLDFTLPGSVGDVLYYDPTQQYNLTNVEPTSGAIRMYIKLSKTILKTISK